MSDAHTFSRERIATLTKTHLDAELVDLRPIEHRGMRRTYAVLWCREVGGYGTHLAVLDVTQALLICGHYDLDRAAAHTDFERRARER